MVDVSPPISRLPRELHAMIIPRLHELDRLSLGLTCRRMYDLVGSYQGYNRYTRDIKFWSYSIPFFFAPKPLLPTPYPLMDDVLDALPSRYSELVDTVSKCFRAHHPLFYINKPGDLMVYGYNDVRTAKRDAKLILEPVRRGRKIRHQLIVLALTFLVDPLLFSSNCQPRRCIACSAPVALEISGNVGSWERYSVTTHEIIRRWFGCKAYPQCLGDRRQARRHSYVRMLKDGLKDGFAPTLGLEVVRYYWRCQADLGGFDEEGNVLI